MTSPSPGASPPAPIRVFVIEDLTPIREALQLLLDGTPGFACAGTAGSAEAGLAAPLESAPDVVLLDIGLPGMSGIEAVALLRETWPEADVLMLTVHDDEERVFAALRAGASGYLLKTSPPVALLEAVREAHEDGAPMSPSVARRVVRAFQRPREGQEGLTGREREVLEQLIAGKSYKRIAAELQISVNTVAFHVKQVYQKLHVHSRAEAVARAFPHV